MKRLIAVVCALVIIGCSKDKQPSSPTPPPSSTPTRIISLSGNMSFGNVLIGQTGGTTLRISNTGNATLTVSGMTGPSGFTANWTSGTIAAGAAQDVTLQFTPTEERAYSGTVTVNGDHTSGTNTTTVSGTGTRPAGPRTQFGSGKWIVGSDIAAGRYFDDPVSGCYWERLSGLGGTLGEIIANEFVGDNAGQWIVDIASSDRAFNTDSDCGTWFTTQRRGFQSTITSGVWLVGAQVGVGTYRTTASSGCYWERMRSFTGELNDIIANDFVSSGGQQLVDIRPGDVGFKTDGQCGTWSLSGNANTSSLALDSQPRSTINANREAYRSRFPIRR